MNKAVKACLGLAALTVFMAAGVYAQNTSSQQMDTGTKKMMTSPDVAFAMKAAQGGMAEVQLGKLAADKGSNPDVKDFGQHMVEDHTKANDDLKSIAQGENLTLPSSVNGKDQAEYTKLQGLSGRQFDHEYVRDMVKDHEEDVKDFQKEANKGKDPQIKSFAQRTLPTLQEHLSKIKSVQSKLSSGGSSKM